MTNKDYLLLLWIPLNVEAKTFNSVDRIVVTKGSYAQIKHQGAVEIIKLDGLYGHAHS